ncbi:DUF5133 domain-containing protein [Streptomyces sp. NBC_00435]|uniref:DUF5133 domain-containing protein n=1 Tax=Streptomyces sp. NBC_00435 TaxID=2903649 RepID=UPI002E2370D8
MTASQPLKPAVPPHATRTPAPPQEAGAWAVGTLMAMIPALEPTAELVLSTAAARAGLTRTAMADAMLTGSDGTPLPAGTDRALRHAVQAARAPETRARTPGPSLMPLLADAGRALGRFFDARLRLAAAPADAAARREFEDTLFTLCVLMGRPCAHTALYEALQYTEG